MNEWIDLKEREPKEYTPIITASNSIVGMKVFTNVIFVYGKFFKGDFFDCEIFNVTHWMPLPEPPTN